MGKLYMPVLKWKAGERKAIINLDNEVRDVILPLIEIMDIPETRKKEPTIEEYMNEIAEDIAECWGDEPVFIDYYDLDDEICTDDDEHCLVYLFRKFIDEGVSAIPVITFDKSENYIEAAFKINSTYKTGICVRVTQEYIDNVSSLIESLKNKYKINNKDLSLVLDFKYFNTSQVNLISLAADAAIKTIKEIETLSFIAICGTGFPESISNIESRSVGEIDRSEWLLWNKLNEKRETLKRMPVYGDYNLTHPDIIDFDPVKMTIGAKIKYTTDDKFIIFKGSSLKKDGSEQIYSLAKKVVNHEKYSGEAFSWGDEYIDKCSRKEVKPGNPQTWVTVAINHHLTYVIYQLSS